MGITGSLKFFIFVHNRLIIIFPFHLNFFKNILFYILIWFLCPTIIKNIFVDIEWYPFKLSIIYSTSTEQLTKMRRKQKGAVTMIVVYSPYSTQIR